MGIPTYVSARAIMELNHDLASGIKEILGYCDELSSQLKKLGNTFQDEGYSVVQGYISRTQNKVQEALPDLKTVCDKLTQYAELVQQSRASIQ